MPPPGGQVNPQESFSISSHPGDKMLELIFSSFSCHFHPKFRPFSGRQLKYRVKFRHISCHSYIPELDIYLSVYTRIIYIELKFNFRVKFGPFLLKFHEILIFSGQSKQFGNNSGHFCLMARIRHFSLMARIWVLAQFLGRSVALHHY